MLACSIEKDRNITGTATIHSYLMGADDVLKVAGWSHDKLFFYDAELVPESQMRRCYMMQKTKLQIYFACRIFVLNGDRPLDL